MDNNQNPTGYARDSKRMPAFLGNLVMGIGTSPVGFLIVIPAAFVYGVRYNKRARVAEQFRLQAHQNLTAQQVSDLIQAHLRADLNLKNQAVRSSIATFQPTTDEAEFLAFQQSLYTLSK